MIIIGQRMRLAQRIPFRQHSRHIIHNSSPPIHPNTKHRVLVWTWRVVPSAAVLLGQLGGWGKCYATPFRKAGAHTDTYTACLYIHVSVGIT